VYDAPVLDRVGEFEKRRVERLEALRQVRSLYSFKFRLAVIRSHGMDPMHVLRAHQGSSLPKDPLTCDPTNPTWTMISTGAAGAG